MTPAIRWVIMFVATSVLAILTRDFIRNTNRNRSGGIDGTNHDYSNNIKHNHIYNAPHGMYDDDAREMGLYSAVVSGVTANDAASSQDLEACSNHQLRNTSIAIAIQRELVEAALYPRQLESGWDPYLVEAYL